MSGPPGKSYLSIRKDIRRPSVTVTSPSSPDPTTRISRFGPVDQGKIQLKIWVGLFSVAKLMLVKKCEKSQNKNLNLYYWLYTYIIQQFDPLTHQLTVTVINACDLPSSRHGLPNPFTKLCLLPDRRYCKFNYKRSTKLSFSTKCCSFIAYTARNGNAEREHCSKHVIQIGINPVFVSTLSPNPFYLLFSLVRYITLMALI